MEAPKRLIQELIAKNATIAEAQGIIDDETSKYLKAIATPKQVVENCGKRIEEIKDTTLVVGLQSLVEQVAECWEVDVTSVDTELEFIPKYTEYPCSFQELIDWQTGKDNIFDLAFNVKFHVIYEDEYQRRTIFFHMPLNPQTFASVQKDGRTFKECLKLVYRPVCDFEGYAYENTFECDNYKNLNFTFKLENLLDKENKLTEKGEIIINAYEKENNAEKELA